MSVLIHETVILNCNGLNQNFNAMKHLGLIPLRNFAIVDENKGLYRSAQPEYSYEYEWLKNVAGIDLIINLRAESHHDEIMIPSIGGIEVRTFDVTDHHEPTLKQANDFIKCIKAAVKGGLNVLFHCEHGHGRTSTFCVLARLATGWNLQDAIKEEEEKFHYNFKHAIQKNFLINNFSNYKI